MWYLVQNCERVRFHIIRSRGRVLTAAVFRKSATSGNMELQGIARDNPGFVSLQLSSALRTTVLFTLQQCELICLYLNIDFQRTSNANLSSVDGKNGKTESIAVDVEHEKSHEIAKAVEADPWSLPELTDTGVPWSGRFKFSLLLIYSFFSLLCITKMPGSRYKNSDRSPKFSDFYVSRFEKDTDFWIKISVFQIKEVKVHDIIINQNKRFICGVNYP